MAWYYFKQHAARHHEPFGEVTFLPVVALGKGHKITTMDELIYAWFKRYGMDIMSQGESPLFIACNQTHALPFAMANLAQKRYYQRSMMQNTMQNKLIQFKDRKNAPIIVDKIRIAGPGAKYLNETLLFDGIAKSMFPLRKVIKNLIYEYLYIDQESYPAILLKKMARYHQLNEYLSLSNSAVDLAIEFNKRNEVIPSSGLFNFSSNVLNKHKTPKTTRLMHLIRKSTLVNMQQFLDLSPLKSVPNPARLLRSSDAVNKTALQNIRTSIRKQFKSFPVDGSLQFLSNTADLYPVIFSEMQSYLITIIKQCSQILGVDPHQFSFCYLGSNAKAQATPFSDLEFFVLVNDDDENTLRVVKELIKFILLKVINLGETVLPNLGISLPDCPRQAINF